MDPISKAIASDENRNLELGDDQGTEPLDADGNDTRDEKAVHGVQQTSAERRIPVAPEIVVPELEKLETWDEAASGTERMEPVMPEDESSLGEELVLEGADEADIDLRKSTEEEEEEDEDETAD